METLLALLAATLPAFGDTQAPKVEVFFPPRGTLTDAKLLTVSGSVADESRVASVTVNGVAAQVDDVEGRWRAQVPIGVGDCELVIASADVLGNLDARAATTSVRNDGTYPMWWSYSAIAPDGRHAYAFDNGRNALVEVDLLTGLRRVVADENDGGGVTIKNVRSVDVDMANGRLLVVFANALYSVDLTTGVRTLVSSGGKGTGPVFWNAKDVRLEVDGAHAIVSNDAWYPLNHLMRVDLATGNRAILSGLDVGIGPRFGRIYDTVLDHSGTQAFVTCGGPWRVFAVDLVTGARRVLASPGVGSGAWFNSILQLGFDATKNAVVGVAPGVVLAIDPVTGDRTELIPPDSPASAPLQEYFIRVLSDPSSGDLIAFPNDVLRIDPETQETRILSRATRGRGDHQFGPSALGFESSGDQIWYLNRANFAYPRSTLCRLDVGTGQRTELVKLPFDFNGNLFADKAVFDFAARCAWVYSTPLSSAHDWGYRVDLATLEVAPIPGFHAPDWPAPGSVTFDPDTHEPVIEVGSLWRFHGDGSATEVSTLTGLPVLGYSTALCADDSGRAFYLASGPYLLSVDAVTGVWWCTSSPAIGGGPILDTLFPIDFDGRRRQIVLANHKTPALIEVDPLSAVRTVRAAGECAGVPVAGWVGGGAPIDSLLGVSVDDHTGVVYAVTGYRAILAIEIESGDRVVVAH